MHMQIDKTSILQTRIQHEWVETKMKKITDILRTFLTVHIKVL